MIELLAWVVPLAWGLATVVYMRHFLDDPGHRDAGLPRRIAAVAVVLHLLVLAGAGLVRDRLPFGTMMEALSFAGVVLGAAYLVVEKLAATPTLGAFYLAPVVALTAGSALFQSPPRLPPLLQTPLFAVHATSGTAAVAMLLSSSLLSAAYLLQYRALSRRNLGIWYRRLPDLATLDRLLMSTLVVGTALLCIAVVAGVAWLSGRGIPLAVAGSKGVLVLGALLWHAAIPLLRLKAGYTARRAAWLGLGGAVWVALVILAGSHVG